MLCRGLEEDGVSFKVIDLSLEDENRVDGRFTFRRFAHLCKSFLKAFLFLFSTRSVVYLTIAQSWFGFCRDSVFILLATWGNRRIVAHLHGGNYDHFYASLSSLRQYIVRYILRKTDKIIILGESLKGMFDFDPCLRDKLYVVYNGLPHPLIKTCIKPKKLPPMGRSRPKILFLSNLIVSKGYLQVLEALSILIHSKAIDIECHFCGSFVLASDMRLFSTVEEARADFIDKIGLLKLEEHAFWHGTVDGEEKQSQLNDCHFFLLPTQYANEGQPISIIEALASGLVVITTAYRTIPEMLNGGEAGEFVPFERPDEIARIVESYIREPDRFAAKSQTAIERYQQAFTREVHLKRLSSAILGTVEN